MKITDTSFLEKTRRQTAPYMQALENGRAARDIARDIYCTLPDKTDDIAYMMADSMAETIAAYHADFDACYADEDAYIVERLRACTEDIESPLERCRIYHRMLVALTANAISIDGGANAEARAREYAEAHQDFCCSEDEAADREQELFENTVEALKNANLAAAQLMTLAKRLRSDTFELADGIAAIGRESADLKLIIAMQAYVNAQNNMYEDISPETSMEQIVYAACGAVDACAAAAEAETGTMDKPTALKVLRVIGKILGIAVLFSLGYFWIEVMSVMLMVSSPFGVLLSIVLATLATAAIIQSENMVETAAEIGADVLEGTGELVGMGAGALVGGVRKLADWSAPIVKSGIERIRQSVLLVVSPAARVSAEEAASAEPEAAEESPTGTAAQPEPSPCRESERQPVLA